jgi:undecaprenyl pyrophosphate synthase
MGNITNYDFICNDSACNFKRDAEEKKLLFVLFKKLEKSAIVVDEIFEYLIGLNHIDDEDLLLYVTKLCFSENDSLR